MPEDIRDRSSIGHADVTALNFVRSSTPYMFRRHFRQGLRSHIMEILNASDVEIEQSGKVIDGVRWFPKAPPRRMFRIFRARLETLENALFEIGRVKIVERYLAPDFMARSTECIVDYRGPQGRDLVLCGFQEYVRGEILDPWTILGTAELLPGLYETFRAQDGTLTLSETRWIKEVRKKGAGFIEKIKRMVTEAGHIPDLAGAGNLIITVAGGIRLVDINNISRVSPGSSIDLDEKGYPVCDKSIEALSLIEEKLLGRSVDMNEKLYQRFLDPQRRKGVMTQEKRFWKVKDTS
ncbi:hypothetical protein [uncultured Desulfosarcina sp.]|uniref:hypothetical protein n=1 Tax=uncultured Desulfosarcina sp. TaxID=218289 RepID=UPI0029C6C935|nr:hypothetical protein [uncultured Desulfosarcina sp.]